MPVEAERPQYVFGYGSLAALAAPALSRDRNPDGFLADLPGFTRTWGVAMDNRVDLPGYKFYVDAVTGERPQTHVAFLDVQCCPGESVNGVCMPVKSDDLRRLDARERNYARVDVSSRFAGVRGTVWAYQGRPEARDRCEHAAIDGRLVIHAGYLRRVRAGFARLGDRELDRFTPSTTLGIETVELERREIPQAAPVALPGVTLSARADASS